VTESQIQDAIRLWLGSQPDIVCWRNNIGYDERTHVRFGVGNPGGSDLIGVFRGRAVFIEIKTTTGKQDKMQALFQALVERHHGIYVVLRSVDEAKTWIEEMRRNAR
jgi:hypothetical protein